MKSKEINKHKQLVLRYLQNDFKAEREIYTIINEYLCTRLPSYFYKKYVVKNNDIKIIINETISACFEDIKKYDFTSTLTTWAYAYAIRKGWNYFNKIYNYEKRIMYYNDSYKYYLSYNPQQYVIIKEQHYCIRKAYSILQKEDKRIIMLRILRGKSKLYICNYLGITYGKYEKIYNKAIQELKNKYCLIYGTYEID